MNNSARRVLEILELFADSPEPLTMSDVAAKMGIPKTSVFDILKILTERGFLRVDNPRAKTYAIGVRSYQIGMSYLARTNLYQIAHPILTGIRDRLGETCYLCVEQNGEIIYLDKVESSRPIRSTCNIGSKNHMYLTGLGKAILAGFSEEQVREIASRGMEAHTSTTIVNIDDLLVHLAEIREIGCAYDMGEDNSYVRCAAAPIRDASGAFIGAISVSMLDVSFTPEMKSAATAEITAAALEISRLMGFPGTSLYC